jgi:putative transposase
MAHGLRIAPRTYYAWLSRGPSRRALWELTITEILSGYYEPDECGRRRPECLYGAAKMWAHLNREGIPVARCTVERVMRARGWRGVTRRRRVRTTIASGAAKAPDLVNRHFTVDAPNQLFVADFTYVPLPGRGFVYTALVIDAFAGKIAGWHVTNRADATMVARALADAVETQQRQGHPIQPGAIHHSDAGCQYTSLVFGQHLVQAGIEPSIGSIGDAYDNALAETTIGLYKTECTPAGSPFHTGLHTLAEVEAATAAWVHWYNTSRLMHRLGRRPPAEAEAEYYAQHNADHPVGK